MCGPREQVSCAGDVAAVVAVVVTVAVAGVVAVVSVPSTPEVEVEAAPRLCVIAGDISKKKRMNINYQYCAMWTD